jgi:hypothetical protein
MVEVDPRVRSSLFGLLGVILGAGWVLYGIVGNGDRTFLAIWIVLTILLPSIVTFGLRSRPPA